MTGDCHVPFCEGLGVKFPWATRLFTEFDNDRIKENSKKSFAGNLFNLELI